MSYIFSEIFVTFVRLKFKSPVGKLAIFPDQLFANQLSDFCAVLYGQISARWTLDQMHARETLSITLSNISCVDDPTYSKSRCDVEKRWQTRTEKVSSNFSFYVSISSKPYC